MTQYSDFAYIYDRLMQQDIDYGRWCDYIENLFAVYDCEPETICELACGTGNITSRLSKRGYDVTGVDISSDMLAVAAHKLPGAQLMCIDMAKFKPIQSYDAFLCMIDGINYVIAPKAVENTFKNVKAGLKDGGVFVFDISTRYKLQNILGNETYIHSEYDIFYSWQNEYHEKYNLSDMLLNFFVRDGDSYRRFEERHLQRGWSESQLRKMLKNAGFTKIDVYDELTENAPQEDSERIVFVCR